MKRFLFMALSLFFLLPLKALLNFNTTGSEIEITYVSELTKDSEDSTVLNLALLASAVRLEVSECQVDNYSPTGELQGTVSESGIRWLELGNHFIMRELSGHPIRIHNRLPAETGYNELKNISFKVIPEDQRTFSGKVSAAFLPVYRKMADNFDRSYLINSEIAPSRMLIIMPDNSILLNMLTPFLEWKNARGIETVVATMTETGTTSSMIKNFIENAYFNWEIPPEYILLIGDVEEPGDPYHLPAFFFGEEQNVTDHPYTCLEGTDYFPEILIGRFPLQDAQDLFDIVSKVLYYEKNPYMTDPTWLQSALLVAGNYSGTPPIPTTPVKVTRWLKEKMIDYGYTDVDEVYYPPTYPGTDQIISSINDGVGFVSYRGWGNANGWEFPDFDRTDIQDLNNGVRLPVVTSIVCNTCDFANSVDPCFGEAFLQKDTGGCVAIVGPSDLHTSTKYNNAIFAGFYSGLLDEDIFTFATAVLRGKLELYDNFPLEQQPGGWVEFYYNIYNILGDPSLCMWTTVPTIISCELPVTVSLGTSYLDISLPGLDGAIVTAIKEGEFSDARRVENGQVTLYLDPQTSGVIDVTITKANYHPFTGMISVNQEAVDIGLEELEFSGSIQAGQIVDLIIELQNYGTQTVNSVTADLVTLSSYINITDAAGEFGDMVPGASASSDYQFQILPSCPDAEVVSFTLDISSGQTAKFMIVVNSLVLEVNDFQINDANGFLDPGEEREIQITVENIGNVTANDLSATVISHCDAVTVVDPEIVFGNIGSGETAESSFTALANADCFVGRTALFELDFQDSQGLCATAYFSIVVGEVNNTAPTGPDGYGYYAYDSFDTGYEEHPEYFWIEIDPDAGGNGNVIEMGDDVSESVALPFTFSYYGNDYDSLTVCTNGWISFETTWYTNFRNWNIPAALGPYAMVAAYWDDLIGVPNGPDHDPMRICYWYDAGQDIFIVEWNACVNRFDDTSIEKFQIVLYDPSVYTTADGNGVIQVNYHTINNPDNLNNYSTVGIENSQQSDGLLYSYANIYPASATPLQNGLAIKYTTNAPDNYTGIDDDVVGSATRLYNNYPNPFNPETTISFSLVHDTVINLEIYNLKGQLVNVLLQGKFNGGDHQVVWNGKDMNGLEVASGIYLYRLQTEERSLVKKCVLMK